MPLIWLLFHSICCLLIYIPVCMFCCICVPFARMSFFKVKDYVLLMFISLIPMCMMFSMKVFCLWTHNWIPTTSVYSLFLFLMGLMITFHTYLQGCVELRILEIIDVIMFSKLSSYLFPRTTMRKTIFCMWPTVMRVSMGNKCFVTALRVPQSWRRKIAYMRLQRVRLGVCLLKMQISRLCPRFSRLNLIVGVCIFNQRLVILLHTEVWEALLCVPGFAVSPNQTCSLHHSLVSRRPSFPEPANGI